MGNLHGKKDFELVPLSSSNEEGVCLLSTLTQEVNKNSPSVEWRYSRDAIHALCLKVLPKGLNAIKNDQKSFTICVVRNYHEVEEVIVMNVSVHVMHVEAYLCRDESISQKVFPIFASKPSLKDHGVHCVVGDLGSVTPVEFIRSLREIYFSSFMFEADTSGSNEVLFLIPNDTVNGDHHRVVLGSFFSATPGFPA